MELTHSSWAASVRAKASQSQLGVAVRVLGLGAEERTCFNFSSLANTLNLRSLYRISAPLTATGRAAWTQGPPSGFRLGTSKFYNIWFLSFFPRGAGLVMVAVSGEFCP